MQEFSENARFCENERFLVLKNFNCKEGMTALLKSAFVTKAIPALLRIKALLYPTPYISAFESAFISPL